MPQLLKDQPITQGVGSTDADFARYGPVIQKALHAVPEKTVSMGYSAWLGFYNSHARKLRWSQGELVQRANKFALRACLQTVTPALQARTVGKMGLKGVPGLRIEGRNGVPMGDHPGQQRGGGGGRGGGGRRGGGGGGRRGGGGGGGRGGGRGRGGGGRGRRR